MRRPSSQPSNTDKKGCGVLDTNLCKTKFEQIVRYLIVELKLKLHAMTASVVSQKEPKAGTFENFERKKIKR